MVTATRAPARRALTAERLVRILDLERAGGCHDRAVIGGLDAFLERHAEQSADVQELARRLAPARYRELSPAARTTWLNTEIARLTGAAPAAPASAPAPAQPAATPNPAAVRARAAARAKAPPAETVLKDARLGIGHNQLACYEALGIATADDLLSSQTMLRRHIEKALERYAEAIDEPLPGELRARHQLIGRRQAFRDIHNPPNYAVARRAERRLAFDELLALQLAVVRRKRRLAQAGLAPAIAEADTVRGFLESLPFALTAAQRRSLTEIEGEIASTTPMARLLQGDVGSGRTVVALAAMLACANSGSQAALMAPTEVLAEQHFRTISSLLDTGRDMLSFGLTDLPYMQRRHVRAVLLTGSAGARKRREALAAIRNGSAGLVVGTHALIQDEVEFQRLGLAVVDEQHRFGVEQRSALRGGPDGATAPHLLVMTATPIPRSLALTAYGDLDLSLIDELPPGRAGVATKLLIGRARDEAFARVRVEIAAGRQVFVICPLVEGSESVASRAATEEAERLRNEQFPELAERIELLHGRMPARDKEAAMQRFVRGEAALLVSTAVVEVGIDVPNATVMIIESADRFGLAQLHQFRGRVGRGEARSFCFLLSDEPGEDAVGRLSLVERNHNGFDLAQADLELRGPGDVFGLRQSGQPRLRASALLDGQLIITTKAEAGAVLDRDATLEQPQHAGLRTIAARAESGIIGEAH